MTEHTHDNDCTVDPDVDTCVGCGAVHGNACPDCGQRAYHADNCPVPTARRESELIHLATERARKIFEGNGCRHRDLGPNNDPPGLREHTFAGVKS